MLEDTRTTIGVVQGALGQRWYDSVVTGQDAHAGPTPMHCARTRCSPRPQLIAGSEPHRDARCPDSAAARSGSCRSSPNSRNVIPGAVRMTVDLRNAR